MSKSYKLGLTRNRLFDFENVIAFIGELEENVDERELSKALKMLSVKEPLITSKIELLQNGDAYLLTEAVEPTLQYVDCNPSEFVIQKRKNGIPFTERLFEFFVINKRTIAVFSHTVASDVRSLLILADELIKYYNKQSVAVEPSSIEIFSKENEIPLEAKSFVADRVTEMLDNDWLLKEKKFTLSDYKNASQKYFSGKEPTAVAELLLDKSLVEERVERAEELKIDFLSMVAFSLFSAVNKKLGLKEKEKKLNVVLDRRLYFVEDKKTTVGAFDGSVLIDFPKKANSVTEKAVLFHKSYYDKYSLPFNAFYDEYFLSRLSPSFTDSAYMYKAGLYKSKATKKLSEVYFCGKKHSLAFSCYNVNNEVFNGLSTFCHKTVFSPHKMNSIVSATYFCDDKNTLFVDYTPSLLRGGAIDDIFTDFLQLLKEI